MALQIRKTSLYLSLFAGICIVLGSLTLTSSNSHLAKAEWLTQAGGGLIAPACGSSSPTVTCVGGVAQAVVTYNYSNYAHDGDACPYGMYMTLQDGTAGVCSSADWRGCACSGTMTFSNLKPGTHYVYTMNLAAYGAITPIDPNAGSFDTPMCSGGPGSTGSTSITTSDGSVYDGGSTTITWNSGASSCTGVNFSTGGTPSGSKTVTPSDTTDYSINCNDGTSATTTIVVFPAAISLTADPVRVRSGTASRLTWTSVGATSCRVTGLGVNATGLSGSIPTGAITANTVYTLTCQTSKGQIMMTANVGPLPVFDQR